MDLDRAALPDLPAGVEISVLRQRMPARENVPQRRTTRPGAIPPPPMLDREADDADLENGDEDYRDAWVDGPLPELVGGDVHV